MQEEAWLLSEGTWDSLLVLPAGLRTKAQRRTPHPSNQAPFKLCLYLQSFFIIYPSKSRRCSDEHWPGPLVIISSTFSRLRPPPSPSPCSGADKPKGDNQGLGDGAGTSPPQTEVCGPPPPPSLEPANSSGGTNMGQALSVSLWGSRSPV